MNAPSTTSTPTRKRPFTRRWVFWLGVSAITTVWIAAIAMSTIGAMIVFSLIKFLDSQSERPYESPIKTTYSHQGHRVLALAYSADGRFLAAGTQRMTWGKKWWTGDVVVWNTQTGERKSAIELDQWVTSIAYSRKDGVLAAGLGAVDSSNDEVDFKSRPGEVVLFDGDDLKKLRSFDFEKPVSAVAFSPDGRLLAVSAGLELCTPATVHLLETTNWNRIAKLEASIGAVHAIAFSPDSRTLATADAFTGSGSRCVEDGPATEYGTGDVRLWNTREPFEFRRIADAPNSIRTIGFSTDGESLVIGMSLCASVVDIATGEIVTFPARGSGFTAISADGKFLASESWSSGSHNESELKLWNIRTGTPVLTMEDGAGDPFGPIRFSTDGRHLACGMGAEVHVFRLDGLR